MSSSNAPWLCQYNDTTLFSRFLIRATFPNISDAVTRYRIEEKIDLSDDNESAVYERMMRNLKPIGEKLNNGQPIDPTHMPSKVYLLPEEKLPKDNAIMFRIDSGIFLVNQAVYEVFCEHRLGHTQFSQVYIYDIETEEQLSDTPYYFINVAETREYFNKEKSHGIEEYGFIPNHPNHPNHPNRLIADPNDEDIVLNQDALSCHVDVWHNPLLDDSLFFSNSLVRSLFAIGVTPADFGLVRCQVV